jgi:hypothetical protein
MNILQQGRRDDIDGRLVTHFLNNHEHKSLQWKIVSLQQPSDGEENISSFCFAERLSLVEQVDEFGKNLNAPFGINFTVIEALSIQDGAGLINFYYGILGFFRSPSEVLLPGLHQSSHHARIALHILFIIYKYTCIFYVDFIRGIYDIWWDNEGDKQII